ncbi:MAG: PQQ-binding-like beta-propeller repeat protein [Melioribacteraceae bacterium]
MRLSFVLLLITILSSCTPRIIIRDTNLNDVSNNATQNANESVGIVSADSIENGLSFNWDSETYGSFSNSSFTTFDHYLLTSDLGGRVTCFDIENGKKVGQIKYSGEIFQMAIVNKFKIIFIVNNYKENYSTLVVYDYKKGKEVATTELSGKFTNELFQIGDNIFTISNLGKVYKFNLNGWVLWEKDFNVEVLSTNANDNDNVYFASLKGFLLSVDIANGKLNYKKKISNGFQSGITIDGENLFVGDVNGIMYSVNKANGNINWQFKSNTKIVQAPASDFASIYFGNLSGNLFSLNKKSGKLIWTHNAKGLINTIPLVTNDYIIQPNLKKYIDVLNKKTGEQIQTLEFDGRCRTSPNYYRGMVFFGVDKGEVYSYKIN